MGKNSIHKISLTIVLLLTCFSVKAQSALQGKKHLEDGNKAYKNGEFKQAKELWQRAGENLYRPAPINYNKGNAQYRTENFEEAANSYKTAIEQSSDKLEKAKQYHNLGNTYLKSEKTKEAVEAYKQALRNNPYDEETRYNLAYAQKKLKQEEQKEKNNQKDNQNEDKNDNQDKDKNKENNEEKDDKENKNDKQDGKQDDKNENKSQPKPSGISREQALKDLEAVKNDEKKVMEKLMKLNKEDKNKKTIEKDW
ncbi:MAG: tetratricopeptide repeat protein [Flavobacteriales bacterium]